MTALKYLLYASLGVATVLLLTSDKAKEIRNKLDDKAKESAKRWKDKLTHANAHTNGVIG